MGRGVRFTVNHVIVRGFGVDRLGIRVELAFTKKWLILFPSDEIDNPNNFF